MRKILQRQNYPNRVVTISDVYGTIENSQIFNYEDSEFIDREINKKTVKRSLGRVAKVWSYLEIDSSKLSERILANKELEKSDKEIDRNFRLYLDNEKLSQNLSNLQQLLES